MYSILVDDFHLWRQPRTMALCMYSTQQFTSTFNKLLVLDLYMILTICFSFYSDLTRNPLIVPLKILKGHGVIGGFGVLTSAFHPRQPWLFSGGADGVINLYQDL